MMHISSIKVINYKSYRASAKLTLKTGINVITGQNNVGKTALIEATGIAIPNIPHRSMVTIPKVGMVAPSASSIEATLVIDRQELIDFILTPQAPFTLCVPAHDTVLEGKNGYLFVNHNPEYLRNLPQWALSRDSFQFTWRSSIATEPITPSIGTYPVLKQNPSDPNSTILTATFFRQEDGTFIVGTNGIQWNGPRQNQVASELGHIVAQYFQQRRYAFNAERYNVGVCAFGSNITLKPDASNLAEVLSNLQSNPSRFRKFNETVSQVLPQIKQITVRNLSSNRVEALVWSIDPNTEREDLAVPINQSGTGVGQVLAVLYVVLTAEHSRTIIIDEPQSFLHPGAVRKLIDVLKQYPQHQYILTTHSPTVIAASNPSTITLIKQSDGESDFHPVDPTENEQLKHYLIEIGARLSDAFGADNILWVEGPTEEVCFPMILERIAKQSLMGTAIMAVKHTGDLEGKHAKTVFEIYSKLSTGRGLLPPAIGFIFDKEGRSEQEQIDIRGKSKNTVIFTPRRLYENYLLNTKAIADVVNGISGFRDGTPVTEAEIEAWISNEVQAWFENKRKKYGNVPTDRAAWKTFIHGANLLNYLFKELSEQRVVYDKIAYSVELTNRIIEDAPEDLREIVELVQSLIKRGN